MKKILALVFAALIFAACNKDDTFLYNYSSIGDVQGNTIVSDNGVVYNVTASSAQEAYENQARVAFLCNVLKKISDTEFDIELLSWTRVLVKDYLNSSEITDQNAVGNDPIFLQEAWYSGKYLNIKFSYTMKKDSETIHYINLVLNNDKSSDTGLCFHLRHNGSGESFGPGSDISLTESALVSGYVSFPINAAIPSGASSVELEIGWDWLVYDDMTQTYLPETEPHSTTGQIVF